MLKLKLQFFGHLMRSADSFEKTLMLGKIDGRRRRALERMRWWMEWPTQCTWICASCGSWLWTGKPGMLQCIGSQRVRHAWATELNWTENNTHLLSHTSTGHLSKHCLPEFSDKDLTLKLKYQSDWVSVWITQRRICFQVYSDFWENPVLFFFIILRSSLLDDCLPRATFSSWNMPAFLATWYSLLWNPAIKISIISNHFTFWRKVSH